jgi:hypothetical protein
VGEQSVEVQLAVIRQQLDSISKLTETWAPTGRQLLELQARVDVLAERVKGLVEDVDDVERHSESRDLALANDVGLLRARVERDEERHERDIAVERQGRQSGRYILLAAWVTAVVGALALIAVAIIQILGAGS